eukprot:CAMPEP_0172718686 /NCGR_PEP_ID=MMETSP1074-20121228/75073_1 /TAXON_ID=2916 /ORGANISM="Ceratium fusus, Strain PA161109" /LENGTH=249 /DNA_ID=CAMNT_0013543951 /DNA_START=32 /DNA_END=781 /DNA_ORIENTATION=-
MDDMAAVSARMTGLPVMVITGATSGVGEAAVRRFAANHRVVALARTEAALQSLKQSCGAHAANVEVHVCDVSRREDVVQTCERILDHFGRVDVLINSAGIFKPAPVTELSLDDVDTMIDVNLKGTIYITKTLVPAMIKHKSGKIIMINSVAGTPTWTPPGETVYCASKHGQSGFASALANEMREHGITVMSVHPGGIDTTMQRNLGTPEHIRDKFLTADEVVDAVEYMVNASSKVLVKAVNLWSSNFWH